MANREILDVELGLRASDGLPTYSAGSAILARADQITRVHIFAGEFWVQASNEERMRRLSNDEIRKLIEEIINDPNG